MDFLIEENEILDNKIASINIDLIDAIAEFTEACCDSYVTEARKESFMTKLNKFFADLINGFQNFKAQIQVELDRRIRETQLDSKLHKMHKEMKEQKSAGATSVEVVDCWSLREDYLACVNELRKYAKRFSEMKYKRTSDIDDDISEFNKVLEKHNTKLEAGMKKKITVPIDKMIDFVEDEISGRSKILDSLNDAVTIFKQMQHDAHVIETRKDILGPDIIPKHVGFLRRIATSIGNTIKRWAVKIITTIVFIVG